MTMELTIWTEWHATSNQEGRQREFLSKAIETDWATVPRVGDDVEVEDGWLDQVQRVEFRFDGTVALWIRPVKDGEFSNGADTRVWLRSLGWK